YVTIDRPKVLNALNMATMQELKTVFGDLKDDADVRVVILTGAGEKSFVAGADINELSQQTPVSAKEYTHRGRPLWMRLRTWASRSSPASMGSHWAAAASWRWPAPCGSRV